MKLIKLFLVIVFALHSSQVFAQEFDLDASIQRGSSIYSSNCASCHMVNGTGIRGVYPPLAGADSLMNDIPRLVKTILKGATDTAEDQDVEYREVTHSFSLTDQQVSDILNYIRNSWGNEAEAILPDDIRPALQQ